LAIQEPINSEDRVIPYKIQLVGGFGGNCSWSIKELIYKVLGS
jgi:hypothetical protein